MVFYKVLWWCPRVDNEFKEDVKIFNFKIVKVMKSTPKTRHNHLLLSITFDAESPGGAVY